jgi:hypothetical protein
LRQGERRLGVGQETPYRKQQNHHDSDVPQNGGEECAPGNFAFDPFDAELFILGCAGVLNRSRAAEKVANAGAELLPGRLPVHAEVEAGQAGVDGQRFERVRRLGAWRSYASALGSLGA